MRRLLMGRTCPSDQRNTNQGARWQVSNHYDIKCVTCDERLRPAGWWTNQPRILLEDEELSYAKRVSNEDIFDNRLIHGDNLLALKALEQEFTGRVKCIYIDPPYNTENAFEHYDDGLEHSIWLSLMRDRLELLRSLLHPTDGSLWVSIDDSEAPYLRVLLDEVFGRTSFIASNVWQKRYSRENREAIGDVHEYILTYAMNPQRFKAIRNKVPPPPEQTKVYRNPNKDPRGPWRPIPMTA